MIAHIVLFNPKPTLSESSVLSFSQSISLALTTIPAIKRAQVGRRIAVDAGYRRSFGATTYEYSAIIEFADRAALVQYLNHPLHQQLGQLFWENCESTVISEVELVEASDKQGMTNLVRRPQD